MADPAQRARRTWFLAWLPLFPLVYLLLNAVPFFKAVFVRTGMEGIFPIPTELAMDVSDLLRWGWGLPGLLACFVLPYGTWMCVRERGRLRSWAAGGVFGALLVLLAIAQIGMWAPLSAGMEILDAGGKAKFLSEAPTVRWVLVETWKPHWGRPPTQKDHDHLRHCLEEAAASR